MSTNQGPEYFAAEKRYLVAQTLEEKITCIEEMIRNFKKHKGSENMLSNLKQRLIKFREKLEKGKKSGKGTRKNIRKEGFQCVIIGFSNTGKSSLLSVLTNAHPRISEHGFTTLSPEIGTMDYTGVRAQIVDMPAVESEAFDVGIANTSDCLLLIVADLSQIAKLADKLQKSSCPRIIVFNKADLLSEEEKRKLEATMRSKKIEGLLVSCTDGFGIEELKERIFSKIHILRIYTKEPGKQASNIPMVLKEGSSVRDAAESILKGFSLRVKETRVTGPSSKFPNQRVGLAHVLADMDVVEFHTN